VVKKRAIPDGDGDQRLTIKRLKYAFVKSSLDEDIKSLDRWQLMYDPTWYLLMRVPDPLIDSELDEVAAAQPAEQTRVLTVARQGRAMLHGEASSVVHLKLPSSGLDKLKVTAIPYSSAGHAERPGTTGLIIESVNCLPGTWVGDMYQDVRSLTAKLICVDSAIFGVLKCKALRKVESRNGARLISIDLVFETRSIETPRSLRGCLVAQTSFTLTQRLELARQVARSVHYVHTLVFVYKSIRPESWIGFGDTTPGCFYLIGFDLARSAEGKTYLRGDAEWERNIYRHPSRQGLNPETRNCMQHDIYSLGVCLLEIGLWASFLLISDIDESVTPNNEVLGVSDQTVQNATPERIQQIPVGLAERELPMRVGELYSKVVLNCLTCLDDDNDFGDESEFTDANGVLVSVRYIEEVCTGSRNLSLGHCVLTVAQDPREAERHNVITLPI
jgi:hypothetical protein